MSVERELENHEVRIGTLEDDMSMLTDELKALNHTIAQLNNVLEQGKGGWRVMLAMGAFAGFVGASFDKIVHFFK
jgi:prefoldin subunit 5